MTPRAAAFTSRPGAYLKPLKFLTATRSQGRGQRTPRLWRPCGIGPGTAAVLRGPGYLHRDATWWPGVEMGGPGRYKENAAPSLRPSPALRGWGRRLGCQSQASLSLNSGLCEMRQPPPVPGVCPKEPQGREQAPGAAGARHLTPRDSTWGNEEGHECNLFAGDDGTQKNYRKVC